MSLERIGKYLGVLALLVSAALFVLAGRDQLEQRPFDDIFHFKSPYWAISDDSGSILLVDRECRRMTKMTSSGEVQWTVHGGSRGDGAVFEFYDTKFDARGNVYVMNGIKEFGSNDYTRMEILKYSPDGKFIKEIAVHDNCDHGTFLNVRDGSGRFIFYTCARRADGGLTVTKLDTLANTAAGYRKIEGEVDEFKMAAGIFPGPLYVSTSDGLVLKYRDDGSPEVVLSSPPSPFPDQLWFDGAGGLCFNSYDDMNIYRIAPESLAARSFFGFGGASAEVLLPFAKIKKEVGRDSYFFKWISINGSDELTAVNLVDNRVVVIGRDGTFRALLASGRFTAGMKAMRLSVWGAMAFAALIVLIALAKFYYLVLRKNTSIIVQNIAVFTPILVVSIYLTASTIYSFVYPKYEDEVRFKLLTVAQAAAPLVDADAVSRINSRNDGSSAAFETVESALKSILDKSGEQWNEKLSVMVFKKRNGIVYNVCDPTGNYQAMEPYPYAIAAHHDAIDGSKVSGGKFSDPDAEYMTAVAPVRNSSGVTVGAVGVVVENNIIRELDDVFVARVARGIIVSLLVNFVVLIALSYFLFVSLRAMRSTVKKITGGDFDAEMRIEREDELGDLGQGINFMTRSLKEYISKIVRLNESYYRFVPRNFLELLKVESVANTKLGDNVNRKMAVLFSDIKGFSAISEKMGPQENFNFINSYLGTMGPVIRENGGFVDKYIGCVIMALFERPEEAVRCAEAMVERLGPFNDSRAVAGLAPVSTGIGIHYGDLMLGIVGESERINATVISDTVNLASRLEGLCKYYGSHIIVSGQIAEAACPGGGFATRGLGRVMVKGKKEPVDLFEVLAPADKTAKSKAGTKDVFASGIEKYCAADIAGALDCFRRVNEADPNDMAAADFIARCETLIKNGVPEDFSGVDKLTAK